MNKAVQLIVALAVLGGALYFYWQRRVTFNPVEAAVTSKVTIGKKTFGTRYDGAAEKDSPLVFFVPADRAGGFALGRYEKASEGKQGYGVRFGDGDITPIPMRTVIFVDVNSQSCTNLNKQGWDKKFLESKQDVGELLRGTGALD